MSSSQVSRITPPKKPHGLKGIARDLVVIVVVAVLVSFLVKTCVVRSFYIPSASMENTLQIDDRIMVDELGPRLVPINRGDVVVFKDPGGWLAGATKEPLNPLEVALSFVGVPSAKENDHLIKRVIGLPGDRVACCDGLGLITVNGRPINEAAYLRSPEQPASAIPFAVTVPRGKLWVMGDNRNNSGDSRYHQNEPGGGFVPESDVVGRAFVITWPLDRWAWLGDYPTVFD
ncbi:signal peptidase I [Leifsonia poae]|uniref:signal peptidase I n=1 Tax=Leifsonia poae TaxID=110933 RepID=UPI003D67DD34